MTIKRLGLPSVQSGLALLGFCSYLSQRRILSPGIRIGDSESRQPNLSPIIEGGSLTIWLPAAHRSSQRGLLKLTAKRRATL